MKKHLLLIFVFLIFLLYGNDGAYRSSGGIIYPINEETITLESEFLSFKVVDDVCYVNIQFIFNNPLEKPKKVLTGFQAPGSSGDLGADEKTNRIEKFKIFFENELISYTLKRAYEENGELYDEKDFVQEDYEENSGIYVYLFEIDFKPGENIVNHSYSFPASSSVLCQKSFSYILRTGAKWSGNKIKDLKVEIDMGDNQYFFVEDIFGDKANWSIIGTGKIKEEKIMDEFKMVRVLSGKLFISVKDFTPTKNIQFGVFSEKNFGIGRILNNTMERNLFILETYDSDNDYTEEQLRFFRNAIYAKYGYNFRDQQLRDLFLQYDWYIPDPNLKIEEIKLDYMDEALLDKILEKEKAFVGK